MSGRWRAALRRRVAGPYRALGQIDQRLHQAELGRRHETAVLETQIADLATLVGTQTELLQAQAAQLDGLRSRLGEVGSLAAADHDLLHGELRGVLRTLASDEAENRRRLQRVRADAGYAAAWTDPDPLVSVTVVTRERAELLTTRTLPSILAQTHTNLEVIVVGDATEDGTAEAVAALGDPRVSFRNLPHRLDLGPDPDRRWMVAATMARNEATRHARGRWLVCFDDDDALRPSAIARLLCLARETRAEVAFGRTHAYHADGTEADVGVHPPVLGQWTFASAIYHAGLRCFERELVAAALSTPSDWFTAERMLRAGARFAFTPDVLADIYPAGPDRSH